MYRTVAIDTSNMRRKRPLKYLALSILSLASISGVIYFLTPSQLLPILNYKLSVMNLFLPVLFLFIFSTTTYISKSSKHGVLLGLFMVSIISFKLNNLTHPFFFLLLAALFLVLELMFAYRK